MKGVVNFGESVRSRLLAIAKPESLMDAVAGVKQFLEPALAGKDMSGLIWRSCKCRWTNLKSSAPK